MLIVKHVCVCIDSRVCLCVCVCVSTKEHVGVYTYKVNVLSLYTRTHSRCKRMYSRCICGCVYIKRQRILAAYGVACIAAMQCPITCGTHSIKRPMYLKRTICTYGDRRTYRYKKRLYPRCITQFFELWQHSARKHAVV